MEGRRTIERLGNLAIQYTYAVPEVRGNNTAQMTELERESVAVSLEEASTPPAMVPTPSTPQNLRLPLDRGVLVISVYWPQARQESPAGRI